MNDFNCPIKCEIPDCKGRYIDDFPTLDGWALVWICEKYGNVISGLTPEEEILYNEGDY